MSRKSKIDPALKVELVERYLKGEIGMMEACRQAGLSDKTTASFRRWINIFKNEGPAGLLDQKKNRHYSKEIKFAAVNAYLNGEGSEIEVSKRFGLRSDSKLREWIKVNLLFPSDDISHRNPPYILSLTHILYVL